MDTRQNNFLNLQPQRSKETKQNTYPITGLFKPIPARLIKYLDQGEASEVINFLKAQHQYVSYVYQRILQLGDLDLFKKIIKAGYSLKKIELETKPLLGKEIIYNADAVLNAISTGENVQEILAQFRLDLERVVQNQGFPFYAFVEILKTYDEKYKTWTEEKRKLFCINVLGYFERLSPDWFKKDLARNIYRIYDMRGIDEKAETANLEYIYRTTNKAKDRGLGFDFCIDLFGHIEHNEMPAGGSVLRGAGCAFVLENYLSQRHGKLVSFLEYYSKHPVVEDNDNCPLRFKLN